MNACKKKKILNSGTPRSNSIPYKKKNEQIIYHTHLQKIIYLKNKIVIQNINKNVKMNVIQSNIWMCFFFLLIKRIFRKAGFPKHKHID